MSNIDLADSEDIEVWRLEAFDGPSKEELARIAAAQQSEMKLPTAAEMEAMQELARQEAYHAGYREGFLEGEKQAKILSRIVENFQAELSRLDEMVAAELTAFALGIARKTLGFAYQFDSKLTGKMAEHAIQTLPATLEPTRILLHPEDLANVQHHLSEEFAGRKLSFMADATISRGGLKLMTATTDIDGTFESRWMRVTSSLDSLQWEALPSSLSSEKKQENEVAEQEEVTSSLITAEIKE